MDPERCTCESLRAEVLRTAILHSELPLPGVPGEREALSAPGREHLDACATCALWRRARLRHVAALTTLERFGAPRELEALVVASFSSDSRRERAISALTRLGRLTTPAELDDAMLDGPALEGSASESREVTETRAARRAPRVLLRLVAEEIADPAKARARRFVGSLPRLRAVPELDQLVERELARPTRTHSRGVRAAVYASLAAAVLAAVVGPLAVSLLGVSPKRYPFRVEHVRVNAASEFDAGVFDAGMFDPAKLDPSARELLDGLGGGILGVHRI